MHIISWQHLIVLEPPCKRIAICTDGEPKAFPVDVAIGKFLCAFFRTRHFSCKLIFKEYAFGTSLTLIYRKQTSNWDLLLNVCQLNV